MPLRLKSTDPITCEHDVVGPTMISSPVYVRGCETCIRKAFDEAMQEALKSVPKYIDACRNCDLPPTSWKPE